MISYSQSSEGKGITSRNASIVCSQCLSLRGREDLINKGNENMDCFAPVGRPPTTLHQQTTTIRKTNKDLHGPFSFILCRLELKRGLTRVDTGKGRGVGKGKERVVIYSCRSTCCMSLFWGGGRSTVGRVVFFSFCSSLFLDVAR